MIDAVIKNKPYLSRNYIKNTINAATKLNITNYGFNSERFYKDSLYRFTVIEYYNLLKRTFNVLDIIEKLPHFFGMLEAYNTISNKMEKVVPKFRFISDTLKKILDFGIANNEINTREIYNMSKISSNKVLPGKTSEKLFGPGNMLYDNLIMQR